MVSSFFEGASVINEGGYGIIDCIINEIDNRVARCENIIFPKGTVVYFVSENFPINRSKFVEQRCRKLWLIIKLRINFYNYNYKILLTSVGPTKSWVVWTPMFTEETDRDIGLIKQKFSLTYSGSSITHLMLLNFNEKSPCSCASSCWEWIKSKTKWIRTHIEMNCKKINFVSWITTYLFCTHIVFTSFIPWKYYL